VLCAGLAAGAIALSLAAGSLRGDVLKLKNGESLEGEILLERPDKVFFRTLAGARWVARTEVAEIVKSPSVWQKYAELKKKFPSTALGQFELAMWCAENKLVEEKERHLKTAAALDATFEPAYVALGWVKEGEKWVPPKKETVEIPKKTTGPAEKAKAVEKPSRPDEESERKRNRWSYDISTIYNRYLNRLDADLRFEGAKRILAIKDPLATDGLVEQLATRKDPGVRKLCARALMNMNNDRALFQVLVMAVTDSSPEVFEEACRLLRDSKDPRVYQLLRKGLEGPEDLLERCVQCLGQMKDLNSVPLLVNVLVGRERLTVEEEPDWVAAYWRSAQAAIYKALPAFEPDAVAVCGDVRDQLAGNSGPVGRRKGKRMTDPAASKYRASVQEALIRISDRKENFSSDREAWLQWYKRESAERAKRPGG
jgi:HEAT repeat protein